MVLPAYTTFPSGSIILLLPMGDKLVKYCCCLAFSCSWSVIGLSSTSNTFPRITFYYIRRNTAPRSPDFYQFLLISSTCLTDAVNAIKQEFARLKTVKGIVWYYRENPPAEAPPLAMEVIKPVVDNKLTIKLSETDFN